MNNVNHEMNRVIEFNGFYLDMGAVGIEQMVILFVGFSLIFFACYKLIKLVFRFGSIILNAVEVPAQSAGQSVANVIKAITINLVGLMRKLRVKPSKKVKQTNATKAAMATTKNSSKFSSLDAMNIDEKLMLIPAYARKEANKHYPIYG